MLEFPDKRHLRLALLLPLLGALPASAQWVHFNDRTEQRLTITNVPAEDGKEKDCAVGDFNRDGWSDVVVVRKAPFSVAGTAKDLLLLNESGVLVDRTATFAPEFLTNETDARDVFVADVDSDEWPDLILANTFGQQPVLYRNLGEDAEGDWLGFADESAGRLPQIDIPDLQFCAVCARDLTGDGAPEIYFSNYARAPDVALDVLLLNDGTGHFTDVSEARLGNLRNSAFGTSVEIHDVDGDDHPDIIKTSSLSSVEPFGEIGIFVLFNDGAGSFSEFQPIPTESPYMFAIDDMTADGRADLFVVNDGQDFFVRNIGADLSGKSRVAFEKTVLIDSPRTFFLGGNVQCADLDNDGDLDVAVADVDIDIGICETPANALRKFALLRNEGEATGDLVAPFGEESNPWNQNLYDFGILDLDRDGRPDIFAASCSGYSVFMQEHTLKASVELVEFENSTAGAVDARVVRVCNNGPVALEITSITSSVAEFSASESTMTLAPYECRDVTIFFSPPAPGAYAGTVVFAGAIPLGLAVEGTAIVPPSFSWDRDLLEVDLPVGGTSAHSLILSNNGGSPLRIEARLRAPDLAPERILVTGDGGAITQVERALESLPNDRSNVDMEDLSEAQLDEFDIVIAGFTGGAVTAEQMNLLADAVRGGKTLILLGATSDRDFLDSLQADFLSYDDVPGWKFPPEPHFSITDLNHPLTDGIAPVHNFSSVSASWYRILPDDPAAWVAAHNGDGVPCLLSKRIEAGYLIYFSNWALGFAWDNPVDLPLFERILHNAVGASRLSWISIASRSLVIEAGESFDLIATLNAFDEELGQRSAELVLSTNDPEHAEIVIDIELEVTPAQEMRVAALRLTSVSDGLVGLELSGSPGENYQLQRSPDLDEWTPIGLVVIGAGGTVGSTDEVDQRLGHWFYRAVQQ